MTISDGGGRGSMDIIDFDGNGVQDIVVAVTAGFVRVPTASGARAVAIGDDHRERMRRYDHLPFRPAGQRTSCWARDRGAYVFDLDRGLVVAVAKRQWNGSADAWGEGNDCRVGCSACDDTCVRSAVSI